MRPKKIIIYYGGTISSPHIKDYKAVMEHRENIKKRLNIISEVKVIDPFDDEGIEKVKTRKELYKNVKKLKGNLAKEDLDKAEKSDIILLEIPYVSIGSVSEMATAYFYNKFRDILALCNYKVERKYIIIVSDDPYILNHNFVMYFADWRCLKIDDAIGKIEKVVGNIKRYRNKRRKGLVK